MDLQDAKNKNKSQEEDFIQKIADKNLRISSLQGELEEAKSKGRLLQSQVQVSAGNIEKTYLDTHTLLNVEREKWLETASKQKRLL